MIPFYLFQELLKKKEILPGHLTLDYSTKILNSTKCLLLLLLLLKMLGNKAESQYRIYVGDSR